MVKFQLMGFATLTAVGVSYVGAEYAGLADRIMDRGYSVQADFGNSGGIYKGAEVTYRGVPVGRVGELELSDDDGVLVDLQIEGGEPIPADSVAVVANRSAVGEQYVDLQPRSGTGPYLRDGLTIPRQDTRTPLATTEMVSSLDALVNSVGKKDLKVTVDEMGEAFAGTGPNLSRLVDSGNALMHTADKSLPETIALIEDSKTALKTQVEQGSAIKSFSRDLADLSGQIKKSDGDMRRLMDSGTSATHEIDSLLRANSKAMPILLSNLISGGQVTKARLPNLRGILIAFPPAVAGSFTVAPGDGTAHFGLVLNADEPPACRKGYEGTEKRAPSDTSRRPSNTEARCTEPRGSETSVRGAQNAPGAGPRSGASGASHVAPYDPDTGTVYGPDGGAVQIGSTGGAQNVFGKDSWQWLLVGPMA